MNVEVVVPWRAGCPHREAAWAWVRARWDGLGWPVTVAEAPPGRWVKARAVMPAVEASAADVVVVADADVWCDAAPVAVEAVAQGVAWAVPHGMVWRLAEQVTVDVLAGVDPAGLWSEAMAERPYWGVAGGGLVVLRRDVALDVPLDARFEGWGGEDHAWGFALRALHGDPWRSESPLWHLWHPPAPRMTRKIGCMESETLRRRYFAAQSDPAAMRALVDEARTVGVA